MSDKKQLERAFDCPPLLELATPALYRRNLFRVLQLPLDATPRDVQRREQRRKMREKLGIQQSEDRPGPLSLNPSPNSDEIRAAMQRLNHPVHRLLDEIFWFWPTNGNAAGDPALTALKDDPKEASRQWREQIQGGARPIALHNLAVFHHLTALDVENRGMGPRDRELVDEIWLEAFTQWRQVHEEDAFWNLVKSRVREFDDLQLRTGFVDRVRDSLPTAILLINGKLACGAADRSDFESARRHASLLRQADFPAGFAEAALRESLKPFRDQISAAVESAKSRWTRAPQEGHRSVLEVHERTQGPLSVIDAVLPEDDVTRSSLHDLVSEAMLDGQIAFGNKTDNWSQSLELLDLAGRVAAGVAVKERINQNRTILEKNIELANPWCAPGYWDLTPETIAQMEKARFKSDAGDAEGAIRLLAGLGPEVGYPLLRSAAFSLNQRGWQIASAGLDAFNAWSSPEQRKFLDVIQREGSIRAPTTAMYANQVPPCPCCGRTGYTAWLKGNFGDQPYWMCGSCGDSHNNHLKTRRQELGHEIGAGLKYVLLAAEIDPSDPGIRRSLQSLKKIAGDLSARIPDTAALRQELGAGQTRVVPHPLEPRPADRTCHFCGENAADDSCRISVTMCGDSRSIELLFGRAVEYRRAEVAVPRCRRCRDEHRELPERIERWRASRLEKTDDSRFPNLAAGLASARRAVEEASAALKAEQEKTDEARRDLAEAEQIGERCEKCNSAAFWDDGLCKRCDRQFYALPVLQKIVVAAVALLTPVVLGVLGLLSLIGDATGIGRTSEPAALIMSVMAGLALFAKFKSTQRSQRTEVSSQRRITLERKRAEAVTRATERLERAEARLESARKAARGPTQSFETAKTKLIAAKHKAAADFERLHPKPDHPAGIKPEAAWPEFGRIDELRKRGWSLGPRLDENSRSLGPEHARATGLVSNPPQHAAAMPAVPPRGSAPSRKAVPAGHVFNGEKCSRCGCSRGAVTAFGWACKPHKTLS